MPTLEFIKQVDDMVILAENDQELKDGLEWINMRAREENISFYEMAHRVMQQHMARQKARHWLKSR